jgi:hypothetical protein
MKINEYLVVDMGDWNQVDRLLREAPSSVYHGEDYTIYSLNQGLVVAKHVSEDDKEILAIDVSDEVNKNLSSLLED